MKKFILITIGIIISLCSVASINEHTLTLSPKVPYVNAASKSYFYIDQANSSQFDQVSSPKFSKFTAWNNTTNVSFEYGKYTYWVRFDLENENKQMSPDWLLEVNYAPLDEVEFFAVKDNKLIDHVLTGDHVDFKNRPLQHHNFIFPIKVEGSGITTVYMRVKTDGSVKIPLRLYRPWKFAEINSKYEVGYGLFFGILLMMAVLGVITYIPTKDISYLLFPIPIIAKILFTFSLSGHTFQFLFPTNTFLANKITPLSIGIWMVGISLFNFYFLKTVKIGLKTHRANIFGLAIGIVAMFGSLFLPYYTAIQIVTATSIPFTVLSLSLGIISLRSGYKFSRYYVASFSIYLVALLLFVGRMKGIIDDNLLTSRILEYGDIIMVTLLFTALSKKYAIYRDQKNIAVERMLQVEADAKSTLEKKVVERTLELQEATAELEEKTEELETQANQLALKNEEITTQSEKLVVMNNNMVDKNEELEQQNEEILTQRDMVESKNVEIEKTAKRLKDSINYAKRIQNTILPSKHTLDSLLEEYFIMYQPKNTVSGDFYWAIENKKENKVIIVVADCTGHGVPGAMMSMVGDGFLQQIVRLRGITSPGKILVEMHTHLQNMLSSDDSNIKDGMDMGILVWDKSKNVVQFSGAHIPLVFVTQQKIFQLKGERLSLGSDNKNISIKEHIIPIKSPISFYLFSDGYQDQFGGDQDKKIGSKRLRELIHLLSSKPMSMQKNAFINFFEQWKNTNNNLSSQQLDDILLMGIKVSPTKK
ncbi:hypothetical protein EI427_05760 [Flammeovirga pectinis]|uniref:PPM-type phosphatase domain-containing protein n=1 Tax=Flammeovirga pectinis TaxID=2494373 RepID=A0A3Q9FMN0_9BACT|nr:7TM-DISM domain-containing protein [Flammeovirga pectinis]AZQ61756.1 hypothetical protein EI427_05760 [Flammeovirga pectinis]